MTTWTRRDFLKRTACALVAGGGLVHASPPLIAGAAGSAKRLRFSTSSIHFKHLPIEQACARIAALGFEAIDIWSAHEGCPHLDDVTKRLGPDGLRALLRKSRLKLYAFSVYAGGYAKYAELLGKAGGGVAIQGSAGPCAPADLSVKMRAFLDGLSPLAELAEKHKSYLAIENHGDALLNGLDSFKAFMDLNRHKRVGIALAPYHLQSIKASVEEAVRICGDRLYFFYAWQNRPGLGQLPGHGDTDFAPWMAALRQAKYRFYVNPFMHGEVEPDAMGRALAQARAYLQSATRG